jgi:para-aminobenzoate synthetase component II
MRVLVIDNYDSFVYNLVQYLGQLGVDCDVRRNDEIRVADVSRLRPAGVLLSPGPGTPDRAGVMLDLIKRYAGKLPIFGVCLGHQAIGEAFGAVVTRAPELLHGKTSAVTHTGTGVLNGLPDPFTGTRYHSLAVLESTLPAEIEVTGRTKDSGLVMAMRHRTLPLEGVQFHPESVLTQGGHLILANWLEVCGYPAARDLAPELAAEVEARRVAAFA